MNDDQYNTMLIFANYLLGMNENQTSIRKSHTNNTPFVAIKTKKRKKRNNQRKKQTSHPKNKLKNNDLDSNQDKQVCRPLMTFTKVLSQLMRREEQYISFEFHSTGQILMKKVKEATRSKL
jgi:hypothetical protein